MHIKRVGYYLKQKYQPHINIENKYSFDDSNSIVLDKNQVIIKLNPEYINRNNILEKDKNNSTTDVESDVQFSIPSEFDRYDVHKLTSYLRMYSGANNFSELLQKLEDNINQTFVDKLLYHIDRMNIRDSEVYKAAQLDKRLFSKIVSNREYKPSKDTAVALALALRLSIGEADDLLSRAGYTLSHSNKRDVVIEYFFRDKIYDLVLINEVLYNLDMKTIGRNEKSH